MDKQQERFLFYGAGAVAIYYLVVKPLLSVVGLQKTQERIETEKRKVTQVNDQITELKKVEVSTKTEVEWQVIADQIYEDLRYSAISDNKSDAGYQVARVKNNLDFWILYKKFGKRREYLFGIPAGSLMDLQQFIRSNLSSSAISTLNANYKSKNIKYRF